MSTGSKGSRPGGDAARSRVPYVILAASLAVTLAATYNLATRNQERDWLRFRHLAQQMQDSIEIRMEAYIAVLRATAGLFAASEEVTPPEFRTFVNTIDLQRRYPGIQGIGFTRRVTPAAKDAFVRALRKRAHPDFTIRPNYARNEYHAIIYLEPLDRRNRAAIGYDMSTEPVRRTAMEWARDSGLPCASGRVTMQEIDEERQAGFLIYVPVYRRAMPLETVADRRAALMGYAYSPFRGDDLLRGIIGAEKNPEITIQLFAAPEPRSEDLIYRSTPAESVESEETRLKTIMSFQVAGSTWSLAFATLPAFDAGSRRGGVLLFLVIGVAISGMLFGVIRSQVRARLTAERVAADLRRSEKAESEARATAELAEQNRRILFMNAPLPMWVFDVETFHFLEVNEAAVAHYGYSRDEFLRMRITDIRPLEDLPRLLRDVERDDREMRPSGEWKHRCKDARLIDVEVVAHNLDFAGRHARLVVINDITERKRGEVALKKSEAQVRQLQKMEAVGRLAGGVAHDFNNLLTVIIGCSEVLLNTESKGQSRELIEEIKKAGDRAAALTRQLLAFSRKQVINPAVLDLNAIAADMEKMLRRLIGEHIEMELALEPALQRVRADPGQIEQVLMNLVVNAREAMPKGGKLIIKTANVDLDESFSQARQEVRPGPYVMLAVSDTGFGMDEETKAHIFEPFFTTKEQGKGTGLGLATVYGIVKQSSGFVYVYSEPGLGTAFKIYLPPIEAPQTEHTVHPRSSATPTRGTETVLLVEDEDGVRSLARLALETKGYTVLEARNGGEALQLCEQHQGPIHLLVTDVVMPGMNGRDLADRLISLHPGLNVLFVSGYTGDAIVHHGVLDPDVAFLEKPFTPAVLARKVREVLDSQREGNRRDCS